MSVAGLSGHTLRRGAVAAASVAAVAAGASAPWWGRRALAGLAFFRVRAVEVDGTRYLSPGDVVARLGIDTTASVWDDARPLEARVRAHPQVRSATIGRKLPGTLVVRIVERTPVALAPTPDGLRAYDASGAMLPIDLTRVDLDLPIVMRPDPRTLALLAALRERSPTLFGQISEVRRAATGDLLLRLPATEIVAPADADAARLAMVVPVQADLARRHLRAETLDLRYRDQVVARLP